MAPAHPRGYVKARCFGGLQRGSEAQNWRKIGDEAFLLDHHHHHRAKGGGQEQQRERGRAKGKEGRKTAATAAIRRNECM